MANQIIYISTLIASSLAVALVYYFTISQSTPTTPKRQYIFSDPSTHKIPEFDINMLRKHYSEESGLVLQPNDSEYEKYSTPYAVKCVERPYVVFVPSTYDHAKLAFNLIVLYKEEFKILSGGHDYQCGSIGTQVVINTRMLNKIDVNFQEQYVRVGAGVKLLELYEAVKDSGYNVMGGYCPTVGVSGFTLGGGYNWSTSAFYGTGAENVLELEVILPSGYLVTVNWENEYKDLMWGLLGAGGGNFGFVVEFKLKLISYPEKKYTLFKQYQSFSNDTEQGFPLSMLSEVYRAWIAKFKTFEKRENIGGTSVIIFRDHITGPNSYYLQVGGLCKNCSWTEQLQDLRAKYPGYYTADNVTYDNYYQFEMTQLVPSMSDYPGVTPFNQPAAFTTDYTDDMITEQLHFFIKPNGFERGYLIQSTYIKNSIKNPERTSLPYPQARWKFSHVVGWQDDRTAWQYNAGTYEWNQMMARVGKEKYLGGYVNYKNGNIKDYQKKVFGGNLDRLQEIKAKYDPKNVFKNSYGVPLKDQE